MLSTSCRRMFPVLRNQPLPKSAPMFAKAMAARYGATLPIDKIHDTMPTGQRLHRTKTDDPNAEARAAYASDSKVQKTNSGYHREDGEVATGRDSRTSMRAALICLGLGFPCIAMYFNERSPTWHGSMSMNPILARQRDVKQEWGKGGGGWGTGVNGNGYDQKRAEWGFVDKHRTRTLKDHQPKIKDEMN